MDKLTKGAFGTVYWGENIRTNELVAIKFEPENGKKTLKNEAKIYQYLGRDKLDGFTELKWYGSIDNTNYLVIELLGDSLAQRIQYYRAFCLKTVLILGIQIIKRLQMLHERSLVHRDIKPDNFLFGLSKSTNKHKLHLIDFGISKRFNYDGIHIEETKTHNLIGTPNFVSLNVHNGIEPSRRDDLESCIYIIVNMLFGKLEWFNKRKLTEIAELKANLHLIDELPKFIKQMLLYVRQLKFAETPDYELLVSLMTAEFTARHFIEDGMFDWNYDVKA